MCDYFQIAVNWDNTTDEEVIKMKRKVTEILGYSCKLACKPHWASENLADVRVINAQTGNLQDHLLISQDGIWMVAGSDYYWQGLNDTDEYHKHLLKRMEQVNNTD